MGILAMKYMILQIFSVNCVGYKSSLRGSISMWLPRGKEMSHQMRLDNENRVCETRFIGKIESQKLEILVNKLVLKP